MNYKELSNLRGDNFVTHIFEYKGVKKSTISFYLSGKLLHSFTFNHSNDLENESIKFKESIQNLMIGSSVMCNQIIRFFNHCKRQHKTLTKISQQSKSSIHKNKTREPVKTYIMKDSITGLYKIGKSVNPKFRERTLQSEKPSIKMVKVFQNNIEKKLHNLFSNNRIRGEWFELNKIQVQFICTQFN